jgi:adenine deaminase
MLREGTAARDLLRLLPGLNPFRAQFCLFCTDDRHIDQIAREGSVNNHLRLAAAYLSSCPEAAGKGLGLPHFINMASLNAARHFGLSRLGAAAPGYIADLALYPDLESFEPSLVFQGGKTVARNGASLFTGTAGAAWASPEEERAVSRSLNLGEIREEDLMVRAAGPHLRVIGLRPGELLTDHLVLAPKSLKGQYAADPEKDLAKMAVYDRYRPGRPPALGFLHGLGLRRGALATTVSHDAHNLCLAGMSDSDMALAGREAARTNGGLVMALEGRVLASLPLSLGGLMSSLDLEETIRRLDLLKEAGRELGLGEKGGDPFMALSFASLPVIPSLKLTAAGLFDSALFQMTELTF